MFDSAIGLKKRYRDGDRLVGVGMPGNTGKDRFNQILSADDYDFVSVDGQHSPLNEETLAAFCEMAAEADVFVNFRIKHTFLTYLVGNYLDLGPCGIEVPQVELASTVEEAVRYSTIRRMVTAAWADGTDAARRNTATSASTRRSGIPSEYSGYRSSPSTPYRMSTN